MNDGSPWQSYPSFISFLKQSVLKIVLMGPNMLNGTAFSFIHFYIGHTKIANIYFDRKYGL